MGKLDSKINQPHTRRALGKDVSARKKGTRGVGYRVVLISCCRRYADSHDNLRHSMKPLVDAIANTFGLDDADPRIDWNYSQVKTNGQQGVIVMIERVK